MWRAFSRGVPDARRRGEARRRPVLVCRRLGVDGCRERAGGTSRAAQLRIRAPRAAELQVMRLILHVWRQAGPNASGRFVRYETDDVSPDMSFLELLDVLNERL